MKQWVMDSFVAAALVVILLASMSLQFGISPYVGSHQINGLRPFIYSGPTIRHSSTYDSEIVSPLHETLVVVAGDVIIAYDAVSDANSLSISDGVNTYTSVITNSAVYSGPSGFIDQFVWKAVATTTTTLTITITSSLTGDSSVDLWAVDIQNAGTVQGGHDSSGATATSGTDTWSSSITAQSLILYGALLAGSRVPTTSSGVLVAACPSLDNALDSSMCLADSQSEFGGTPTEQFSWATTTTWAITSVAINSPPSPPTAPTGLTATSLSTTQINLAWTNPIGTLTDNKVYKYSTSSTCTGSVTVIDIGSVVTSYMNLGLTQNTVYSYAVTASNVNGESAPSSCASMTTWPSPPTGLVATAISTSEIDLMWSNPGGTGVLADNHVYIYSGTVCSGTPNIIDIGAVATTYKNTGLTTYTAYSYQVSVVNTVQASGLSSCVTTTTTTGGGLFILPGNLQGILILSLFGALILIAIGFNLEGKSKRRHRR